MIELLEQIKKLLIEIYNEDYTIIEEEFLVNKDLEEIKANLKQFIFDTLRDNQEYLLDNKLSNEELLFIKKDVELRTKLFLLLVD